MKWTTEAPTESGWYWYRASNRYHPTPTFVEEVGGGRLRAVEIYDHYRPFVDEVTVEWWPEKIEPPKE